MKNEKIDVVVTWVDGSDPDWISQKNEYDLSSSKNSSNSANRFRDWELMPYFFRGIEQNLPWVNKVFFVTWGHLPAWLNKDNEKLVIVKHEDFIPKEYLPTFNANTIELNFHRIEGLSENFIIFNDDFFAVDKTSEEDFFKNNKPRDMLLAKTLVNYSPSSYVWHMSFNNMGLINYYYSAGKNAFKHFDKWVNPQYGLKNNLVNLSKMPNDRISSFYDHHLPVPHKKSVFIKLWELEADYLDKVCRNRFRSPLDLSHWLMRYWNLASGNFEPIDLGKLGKYYEFGEDDESVESMCSAIRRKERPILVLNDTLDGSNENQYERYKNMLIEAFDSIMPEKSSYEI